MKRCGEYIEELPKLAKFRYPQTELYKWAQFFNGEKKEELEMLAKSNEYVQRAYDKLVDLSADEEKRLDAKKYVEKYWKSV